MEYRKIPGTDVKVSKICLGTMNYGQQCSEPDAHEQLDYAVSQGVNFLDTAELYPVPPDKTKQGTTERYIGTWLKKRGNRDDLVIATKVAASTFITTRETWGARAKYDKKNIQDAIDGSLERLQTDYVDIYQVHWPERDMNMFGVRGVEALPEPDDSTPIEETLEALSEIVKSGKVRYIGISNENPWGMNEYLRLAREKGLPRVVTIQNQYSLMNRTFEIGLSEICLRENVGLLAYSPLSFGVLSGKYLGGKKPAGARFTLWDRSSERYNPPQVQPGIAAYVELAQKHGLIPAQMAISFVNDRPFVTSNIIGATTMEQLKEDIATADMRLSGDVMTGIAEIYKVKPDLQC